MVSLPDGLLARLDALARLRGTTRSGLLQDLAAAALTDVDASRDRRLAALLDAPRGHGGAATAAVRADRRTR